MSIILKGIDLPEKGTNIVLTIYGRDGTYYARTYPSGLRIKDEAIQIPKGHGRLIDGDELCNEFSNRCPGDCGCCGESDDIYDCGLIIKAPTILGEEKE